MKKSLLLIPALLTALALGCPAPRNDNAANTDGNRIGANTNQTVGANTNGGTGTLMRDIKNKAVQIAVYEYGGVRKVAVVPDPIRVDVSKNHRLRFSAFNGLDADIERIEIDFNKAGNPGKDPFEDGRLLTIDGVDSGTEDDNVGKFRRVTGENGTYKYTVRVTVRGDPKVIELDPQVEIAGVQSQNP